LATVFWLSFWLHPGLGTATTQGIFKDIQFTNSLSTTDVLV
jgi:hypothetical protein